MENSDYILDTREEKLQYVKKLLGLKTKDIAITLEQSESFISKLFTYGNNKLKKVHLHAFSNAYHIPMEIFENKNIDTAGKIEIALEQHKKSKSIFQQNDKLLKILVGDWYLYSYPSNPKLAEVWETKTTFYNDSSVEDQHKNKGTLHIGKNQSIILKESSSSKNITSITFDNHQVQYQIFPFSRVSKSNGINKELFNFGIFSKNKLDIEVVKEILGDKNRVQVKIDYDFLERINAYIEVE